MPTDAFQLCSVCSSIGLQRNAFEQPPFEPEGKYNSVVLTGTLGYLRKNRDSCPLCQLVAHALYKNDKSSLDDDEAETEWEMIWRQVNEEYDPQSGEVENLYGSGLFPRLQKDDSHSEHCIQLIDEPSTEAFLRGRMIPDSIDHRMIQGWLRRCTENHGSNCTPSYLQIAPHPDSLDFMVIDVTAECLVNLQRGGNYVALSYVWGQSNDVTTLNSTVVEFRKPGAFRTRTLPRTIRDAIDLTRVLGFNYLWVDSLCIVQDDEETKGLLISNMDAVYGHAALTIVAASGIDAQAGLPGWRNGCSERQLFVKDIEPGLRLGVLPFFDRAIMESPHAKRGWTYQEGCLSARCLVILEGKAFFSCRAAVWREDVMAEVDDISPLEGANTLGRTPSLFPLRRYSQHVGAYMTRHLSHQTDAVNAFSGIGKALAASMGFSRMFYAMPAVVFDWAILWTGSVKLKRRLGFPSWSWVGWEGSILIAGDTYSSLDQHWLLERTWIEWSLVFENGEIALIWDPERDKSTVSPLIAGFSDGTSEHTSSALEHGGVKDSESISKENVEEGSESDESNESDEEDDNDICPTYGSPSLHNPYGRQLKPQLLSALPARPLTKPQRISNYQNLAPGTLVFSTVVASFTLDAATPFSKFAIGFFRLRDVRGRVCGFVFDDSEHRAATEIGPQSREILLLSQASPGMSYLINRDEIGFAEEYRPHKTREDALEASAAGLDVDGEYVLSDWHSWDFFNVMLAVPVKESESIDGDKPCIYERDGVGFVHKDALAHALGPAPKWRDVLLR